MKVYGLLGFPLTHSFSKKYFTQKFEELGISNSHRYDLISIENPEEIKDFIVNNPEICGLNVTIPHKMNVIKLLDALDPAAERIGAVNVIKIENRKLTGYNSDYFGFKISLESFLSLNNTNSNTYKAMVLGIGGAARAILVALEDLNIPYIKVSRTKSDDSISYSEMAEHMADYQLIINCSPVGTFPKVDEAPEVPYDLLNESHFLYDLVYNPELTMFMKKGLEKGAKVINGYEMLKLQAEKAWEIWNK